MEAQLQQLDDQIGEALELEKNIHLTPADLSALDALISALEGQAIEDTRAALGQLESLRNGYSDTLQRSLANLRTEGYDPAAIQALDAPQVPAQPEPPPDRSALSQPLPEDPRQFADLWGRLTPEQRDWLYSQDHNIGNHDGMPAVDRDHYNRLALADELRRSQSAVAQADALRAQHPDWAAGKNIPHPNSRVRFSTIASPTRPGNANMTLRGTKPGTCRIYRRSIEPSRTVQIGNCCFLTPRRAVRPGRPSRSATLTRPRTYR